MLGRTEGNNVVAFAGDESLVGRIVPVRIDGTTGATFSGSLVESAVLAATAA